jgi:HAD superfamily hydrolase (TIGR01509 family)
MKARGVFFDLYGTLLIYGDMGESWSDWLQALYHGLRPYGLPLAQEELGAKCDGFFSREVPFASDDAHTLYERRLLLLCDEFGIELRPDAVRELADSTANAWQKHHRADPEASEVLAQLKAWFKLALISNYDHPPVLRSYLGELGLDRFFDTIVVSAEAGVEKPNPAIFDIALRAEGLKGNEAVFVGDMALDVDGARAAGLQPILIRRDDRNLDRLVSDYHPGEEAEADATGLELSVPTIRRLSDLAELVERM